jgi:hypothetical protein
MEQYGFVSLYFKRRTSHSGFLKHSPYLKQLEHEYLKSLAIAFLWGFTLPFKSQKLLVCTPPSQKKMPRTTSV